MRKIKKKNNKLSLGKIRDVSAIARTFSQLFARKKVMVLLPDQTKQVGEKSRSIVGCVEKCKNMTTNNSREPRLCLGFYAETSRPIESNWEIAHLKHLY